LWTWWTWVHEVHQVHFVHDRLFLFWRRLLGRRFASGSRSVRRSRLWSADDGDLVNLHRVIGHVGARVGGFACDLFHQLYALGSALSEDGVVSIEPRRGHFSDEELRAVGARTGVGHGQATGLIKFQIGRKFILEAVAGPAFAGTLGIAPLDHEIRDHAMENGAVVKRYPVFHFARFGILPIFGAFGQADKVGHRFRSFLRKELTGELPGSGVEDGFRVLSWSCLSPSARFLTRGLRVQGD